MSLTLATQEPFLGSGVAQATRFFMSFLAQHRTARAVPLPKSVPHSNLRRRAPTYGMHSRSVDAVSSWSSWKLFVCSNQESG